MKKKVLILSLAAAFILMGIHSQAMAGGEGTTGDYMGDMGTQFGRGLWNVVSSPAEIPCTMNSDISAQGGVGAATGFGKGIAFMLRRILVGVCEVGTFMIPSSAVLPPVCQNRKP